MVTYIHIERRCLSDAPSPKIQDPHVNLCDGNISSKTQRKSLCDQSSHTCVTNRQLDDVQMKSQNRQTTFLEFLE